MKTINEYQRGFQRGLEQGKRTVQDWQMGRLPLYNKEAEDNLMEILCNDRFTDVEQKLSVYEMMQDSDFYIPYYSVAFKALKMLYSRHVQPNCLNFNEVINKELREEWDAYTKEGEEAPNPMYFYTDLQSKGKFLTDRMSIAFNIKEKAICRNLIVELNETIAKIYDKQDVFKVMDEARLNIENLQNISAQDKLRDQQMQSLKVIEGKLLGKYPIQQYTGIYDLDMYLGLTEVDGSLIFVYGNPGSGKSAIQNTSAINCHKRGIKAWANSAETSASTLMIKLISASEELKEMVRKEPSFMKNGFNEANFERILRGVRMDGTRYFDDVQVQKIMEVATEIATTSSVINTNKTNYTVETFLNMCKKELMKGTRVFFWDRYELFVGSKDWENIDKEASMMRSFCVRHNCVIFCFIQLNKSGMNDNGPMMNNIRGGAGISHAAMQCIGIKRDEDNNAELKIEKNSYGSIGNIGSQDDTTTAIKFLPMKQMFIQTRQNGYETEEFRAQQKEDEHYQKYIERLNDPFPEDLPSLHDSDTPF